MKKTPQKDRSDARYSPIGLIFEFLGILGVLPFIGYLLDRYLSDQIGFYFITGVILAFILGITHLYRRSRELTKGEGRQAPKGAGDARDVTGKVESIRSDLEDVGRRIDELSKRKGRRR